MEKFPLLDIVIGLSLIYTFLSLLASELTRVVVRMLQWRHKQLQRTILNLLGEPYQDNDAKLFKETITSRILNNVEILYELRAFKTSGQWFVLCGIPPHLFAKVLLDVLQNSSQSREFAAVDQKAQVEPISQLVFLLESRTELPPRLRTNLARMIQQVKRIEPHPEQQLLRLQDEVAFWYSAALKEPSRTYKLHLKIVSFLVSLALVIAANIDSLYMIRRISENTATRAVVMQYASHIQGCERQLNSAYCNARLSSLMESTIVPISWHPANRRKQFAYLNRVIILRTIGGWLLSSLAISMGSRFWLRVFNRLVGRLV